jgi:hypothetical protein
MATATTRATATTGAAVLTRPQTKTESLVPAAAPALAKPGARA